MKKTFLAYTVTLFLVSVGYSSGAVEPLTFDMSMQELFELKGRSLRYTWSEIHPDVWNSNVSKEERPLQQVTNLHLEDCYEVNIKLSDSELTQFKKIMDTYKLRSIKNVYNKKLAATGRRHSMRYSTKIVRAGKKHNFSFNSSDKIPEDVVKAYDAYRVLIKQIIKKRISRHLDSN